MRNKLYLNEIIDQLRFKKFPVDVISPYHIKVGTLNYYFPKGSMNYDNERRLPFKGFDNLLIELGKGVY